MENIFDNKWDKSVTYTGNENLPRYSSGSRWQDALLGLGAGLAEANPHNTPNNYFVDTNYIGNGLARSPSAGGIGSIRNDKYRDPYDLLNYWQSKLRQNKYGYGNNEQDDSLSSQLANIFGTKILGDISTNDFMNYNYPTSIYDTSWNNGDTIYNYKSPQYNPIDYIGGGRYGDFGKSVSDYLGGI